MFIIYSVKLLVEFEHYNRSFRYHFIHSMELHQEHVHCVLVCKTTLTQSITTKIIGISNIFDYGELQDSPSHLGLYNIGEVQLEHFHRCW